MLTERISPRFVDLDAWETGEALEAMLEGQMAAVAASGTTPFTVAGVRHATQKGALSIGIANNPGTPLLAAAQCPILVETGSELIAGSTRMKAGTSQKIVLNLFSTGIMVRMGRVY